MRVSRIFWIMRIELAQFWTILLRRLAPDYAIERNIYHGRHGLCLNFGTRLGTLHLDARPVTIFSDYVLACGGSSYAASAAVGLRARASDFADCHCRARFRLHGDNLRA